MRLVVTHMSSDRNKGDFAILAATIQGVRRLVPEIAMTAVSAELPTGVDFADAETRLTRELGVAIVGTPVPSFRASGEGRGSWLLRLFRGELSLLAVRLGSRGLKLVPSRDRPFFEALRHADVVIAKGGSYLYSHGGASEILYLWRMLYPLRAALAAGRRPSVFGVTLGPFEPSFTARLAARVLGRCEAVYVREELSAETARGLLRLPPSTVVSIPDVAFSYESSARPTVDRYAIGFTVRSLPTHGAPTIEAAQRRYEEAIVAAGERQLAADPALKLVFVPQVLDDVGLGVRLRERFSDPSRVEVIEDDLAPDDLMAIYSSLELLVATRLHSAILAAVSGTPIIHLVYEREKGIGVMARLGLERWTRLSQELDGEDLARLIEKLRSESEEVRAHLTVRVPALRAEVEGALERLFNAGPNASE